MKKLLFYLIPLVLVHCLSFESEMRTNQFNLYFLLALLAWGFLLHKDKNYKELWKDTALLTVLFVGISVAINLFPLEEFNYKMLYILPFYVILHGIILSVLLFLANQLKLDNWLYVGLIVFIATVLIIPLGGRSVQVVIAGFIYGGMGYYLSSQSSFKLKPILAILAFPVLLLLPTCINHIINLPMVIIPVLALSIIGNLYPIHSAKNLSLLLLCLISNLAFGYIGEPNLRAWYNQKPIAGISLPVGLSFHHAATKEPLTIDDFRGKITVLDLYNNYCGYCFQKFPDLEQVYQRYKEDEQVQVFAVNLQTSAKGDTEELLQKQIQTHIKDKGLQFPVLKADSSYASLCDKLQLNGLPHVLVLDQNLNIVYRGHLYVASNIKIGNIFDVIEGLRRQESGARNRGFY